MIDSIDDLDPRRIRLSEIGKRYVDRQGNRFCTRYNPLTRQVEFVRLARNLDQAEQIRQNIIQERRSLREQEMTEIRLPTSPEPGRPAATSCPIPRVSLPNGNGNGNGNANVRQTLDVDQIKTTSNFFADQATPANIDKSIPTIAEPASSPLPLNSTEIVPSPLPTQLDAKPPAPQPPPSSAFESINSRNDEEDWGNPYYNDSFDDLVVDDSPINRPAIMPSDASIDPNQPNFYEAKFGEELTAEVNRNKERIQGSLSSLRKSGYFESRNPDIFVDIQREIDINCIKLGEAANNYFRELTSYPRPVSYYLSRMNDQRKERINALNEERKRYELVRQWEIQDTYEDLFNHTKKQIMRLIEFLDATDSEEASPPQKQALSDTITGCRIILDNSELWLERLSSWRKRSH